MPVFISVSNFSKSVTACHGRLDSLLFAYSAQKQRKGDILAPTESSYSISNNMYK